MDEQDLEKLERDVMKARQEKVCILQQMKCTCMPIFKLLDVVTIAL